MALSCGDDSSGAGSGGTGGTGGAVTGGVSGMDGSAGTGLSLGGSTGDATSDAPTCPSAPVDHVYSALEANVDVPNPSRGLYDVVELASNDDFKGVRAAGRTLAYAGVSLLPYIDAPIPSSFVVKLSAGLDRVRAAKIKVVLRFVYREDFTAPNDAKLSRILEHIQTLAPLLQQHADVIAVFQAGFIGPWGEWHSSTNKLDQSPTAQKAILDALLAAAPPQLFVLVRRWSFKQTYAGGAATEAAAFGTTAVARVGHHNDCFLSSDDDVGTYPAGQIDAWKNLLAQDTRFVPMGGETCADFPARTKCAVAVPEMQKLHWSFLNALYHPAALARFKSEGCHETVKARLGYRLVLESASFPEKATPGCALNVSVKLRNDGFAPPYSAPEMDVVLDGPTRVVQKLSVDPRRFEPGPHTFQASVPLPANLPAGVYRVALSLPDPALTLRDVPEYAIRFANASGWDDKLGANVLFDGLSVGP